MARQGKPCVVGEWHLCASARENLVGNGQATSEDGNVLQTSLSSLQRKIKAPVASKVSAARQCFCVSSVGTVEETRLGLGSGLCSCHR